MICITMSTVLILETVLSHNVSRLLEADVRVKSVPDTLPFPLDDALACRLDALLMYYL